MKPFCAWLALVVVASGCGQTGQDLVTFPFEAQGTAASFMAQSWSVTLTEADLAVGPIYFCAARGSSSDLCPTANGEFTEVALVDGIDPGVQSLGSIDAITGEIHTAAYDYGIVWLLTESAARPLDGAVDSAHSAHFAGTANNGPRAVVFSVDVDIAPLFQGTHVIAGVPTEVSVENSGLVCRLHVDPSAWWRAVDFDELAQGPNPLQIEPDSRAYAALVVAMSSSSPPTFEWIVPE